MSQETPSALQHKIDQQQQLIRKLTEENETLFQQFNHLMVRNNKLLKRIDDQQQLIDGLHLRMEELQLIASNQLKINDRLRLHGDATGPATYQGNDRIDSEMLFERWRSFPGQIAHNTPNLRKQVAILVALHDMGPLSANDLFQKCIIGGVTGARYLAHLKRFGLVNYVGARKKGRYELSPAGIKFVAQGIREVAGSAVVPGIQSGIPMRQDQRVEKEG